MEYFKDIVLEFRKIDPELKEEIIKPILEDMLYKTIKFNIDDWLQYMTEKTLEFPSVQLEIEMLKLSIEKQARAYVLENTESSYLQLLNGTLSLDDQVYRRDINPFPGQSYTIFWSLRKASKLIKDKNKKKQYVAVHTMNIDVNELNRGYLQQAIHNKKPAILIEFEPFKGLSYDKFLIDGNHRAYANQDKKDLFPTYILNSEEQLSVMVHPFFQYHYLLHVLFKQLQHAGQLADTIILDPTSRYNSLKSLIEKEL